MQSKGVMKMRLIEVADLEKFIRENVCAIGDDHLLLVAGDNGRWHEALPLVKTAYDVDKVVEELEKLADESYKSYCIAFNSDDRAEYDAYTNAIEIVKQGGVADDVCEWESDYGFVSDKYKRETGCGYTFYDLHHAVPFKYCPYCGKKIKVVE